MVSQEDEAIERRAREKLLARRNDHAIERRAREKLLARKARAAAARANGNGLTTNSIKLVMEEGFNGGARTKLDESFIHNEQQEQQEEEETVITPEPVSEPGSAYSRPKDRNSRSERRKRAKQRKKMSGRGEMAPRDRGPPPPRGRHHYRDEFGRQPPPPHWGDAGGYNRGPPSYRDGGIPPGRWERDRGMARGRHRDDRHYNSNSNSNNNRNRDRHNHRSRRDRSYSSSPSRSRSLSSRGSSSSFSSSNSERSEASSYHSDDSRSLSRSRSRSSSRSRSPSAQSPVPKNIKKEEEKTDSKIDEQKNKKDSADKLLQEKVKKEDSNGTPSSKDSKRSTHSRSRSRSVSEDSRERRRGRDRKRKSSRKSHRSRSRSVSRSHSPASYSDASSHYSRRRKERKSKRRRRKKGLEKEDAYSKDQRTIFVSQLVMRTTEKDLKKYFKRKVGCKVNDVILLRDRRNSRNHKGCAYVEVGRIQDVATAVAVSGQPPDFQRFPILIKASEAEKNYSTTLGATVTTKMDGSMNSAIAVTPNTNAYADHDKQGASFLPPLKDETGRLIESQKVYVGGLDPSIREDHLYALFSPFGNLQKVQLQCHPNTQLSRGYAFLTFYDPKVSNLAIRTMAGKIVTGRPLKTGWANQNQQSTASLASGCVVVTSDQYPDNASELAQKALAVLAQMTGAGAAAAVQQQQQQQQQQVNNNKVSLNGIGGSCGGFSGTQRHIRCRRRTQKEFHMDL